MAYGRSQARGHIRAAAVGLHHSHRNMGLQLILRTTTPDPNPLREARDQTCIFMDTSQVLFHWATMGAPWISSDVLFYFGVSSFSQTVLFLPLEISLFLRHNTCDSSGVLWILGEALRYIQFYVLPTEEKKRFIWFYLNNKRILYFSPF